jgi:hypothetical protein
VRKAPLEVVSHSFGAISCLYVGVSTFIIKNEKKIKINEAERWWELNGFRLRRD